MGGAIGLHREALSRGPLKVAVTLGRGHYLCQGRRPDFVARTE